MGVVAAMTLALSAGQRRVVVAYLEELYRWNRRLNLTRIAREHAFQRHVGEALTLLAVAAPAPGEQVVDVGSGSGVPGLVIAIARPDLEVTLVESDARRAAFLVHTAGSLRLDTVRVARMRAEAAGRDPRIREAFHLAVARALAPPPVLLELALPLVRVGGRLCALWSGDADEASRWTGVASALGGGPPSTRDAVLVVHKSSATPARYPRRSGTPTRHPLESGSGEH
jgi:16S rRNA (guanine527-N7)-methyltransferase